MANIPHDPTPIDGAENVSVDLIKLEWGAAGDEIPSGYEAGDFDGMRYEVYFYSTTQHIPYDWLGFAEDTFFVLADAIHEPVILDNETVYQWRIDVMWHTWWGDWHQIASESDTWSFTTERPPGFSPPAVSYDLISGGSGAGPYDDPPGVEGTDFRYNGENNMITVKRLVAAANNKIWIEDL